MDVVCLEETAFYALIEKVVERLKEKHHVTGDQWIGTKEAMKMLRITSKTTLQKLRDTGAIRFSQPEKKMILYDAKSIHQYLEKHVRETF